MSDQNGHQSSFFFDFWKIIKNAIYFLFMLLSGEWTVAQIQYIYIYLC